MTILAVKRDTTHPNLKLRFFSPSFLDFWTDLYKQHLAHALVSYMRCNKDCSLCSDS